MEFSSADCRNRSFATKPIRQGPELSRNTYCTRVGLRKPQHSCLRSIKPITAKVLSYRIFGLKFSDGVKMLTKRLHEKRPVNSNEGEQTVCIMIATSYGFIHGDTVRTITRAGKHCHIYQFLATLASVIVDLSRFHGYLKADPSIFLLPPCFPWFRPFTDRHTFVFFTSQLQACSIYLITVMIYAAYSGRGANQEFLQRVGWTGNWEARNERPEASTQFLSPLISLDSHKRYRDLRRHILQRLRPRKRTVTIQ